MKCYYAHCRAIYDTPQEKRDIELLQKLGFEVYNPNSVQYKKDWETKGMEFKKFFAETCDIIVFRSLYDGRITAGVSEEIAEFKSRNKPVLELPSNILGRGMDVEETKEFLHESGER